MSPLAGVTTGLRSRVLSSIVRLIGRGLNQTGALRHARGGSWGTLGTWTSGSTAAQAFPVALRDAGNAGRALRHCTGRVRGPGPRGAVSL